MKPRWMVLHAKDLSEPDIRDALEKAGFEVWDYLPTDLLTWRPDKGFQLLECKTPTVTGKRRSRKDQAAQTAFLVRASVPVALTPEMALKMLGAV